MSKKVFSEFDIKKLEKNSYVKRVSEKAITYSDEFKILFIEQSLKGMTVQSIFEEAGFDVSMIGMIRVRQAAYRWLKAYHRDGIVGLRDTRAEFSGRPRLIELSQEEIIKRQDAKIKLLEGQIDLLKKLDKIERRQINKDKIALPNEVFDLIHQTVTKYNISSMISDFCKLLGVSRSGYYRHLAMASSRNEREKNDLHVRDIILKAYKKRGYNKGSRSIKMVLEQEEQIIYSRKRIQRIMRKYEIICPIRKANPYKRMMKATREHSVVPNKLERKFKQGIPGKILLTDITYLHYGHSKLAYLSTIKDASTNEILAFHLSERMTIDLATITIEKLIKGNKKRLHKEAYIHSDQGVHYTSPIFQRLLKKHKLGQSMSRRGNCWDNAPQESFFGHMKDEIDYKSCQTFCELEKLINNYMNYYNHHRYQWGLKKLTPIQYRTQLLSF